jgi:endonuclease/exonuclease/phosphatase family metal-dependent hydrolase
VFAAIKEETLPVILAGDFNEHDMFAEESFKKLFNENGFSFPLNDHNLPTYRKENIYVNNWINRVVVSHRYDYIVTKNIERIGLKVHSYAPLYLDPVLSDHDPVSMILHSEIK